MNAKELIKKHQENAKAFRKVAEIMAAENISSLTFEEIVRAAEWNEKEAKAYKEASRLA